MEVRIKLNEGGDGTTTGLCCEHDTGSNVLTVFDINIAKMKSLAAYTDLWSLMTIHNANEQEKHLFDLILEV